MSPFGLPRAKRDLNPACRSAISFWDHAPRLFLTCRALSRSLKLSRGRSVEINGSASKERAFMGHEQFAAKIAYACIFAKTPDDATENLVRLIRQQECGFDEGLEASRKVIEDYLGLPPEDLLVLNRFGASFSTAQWRLILEQVISGLP